MVQYNIGFKDDCVQFSVAIPVSKGAQSPVFYIFLPSLIYSGINLTQ